jgi:hypothetical protein
MNATVNEWLDPIRQELNLKELARDARSSANRTSR